MVRRQVAGSVVTVVVVAVALVTLVWPTWIEELSPWSPDGGDGASELWLARGVALAALVGALALARVRRARHTPATVAAVVRRRG